MKLWLEIKKAFRQYFFLCPECAEVREESTHAFCWECGKPNPKFSAKDFIDQWLVTVHEWRSFYCKPAKHQAWKRAYGFMYDYSPKFCIFCGEKV